MDIAEKRVFDAAAGRTRLAVGTGAGLAVVGISDDVIGEFGLAIRDPVRDLAAAGEGRLLVATGTDVLVVRLAGGDVAATADVVESGAGPADAVAVVDRGALAGGGSAVAAIAAGSDGVVRRASLADADADSPARDWTALGEADVRAADGRLLAAADGVYRIGDDRIDHVGLDDVRDVAAAGPLAATADGCYRLGPGWTRDLEGTFDVVAADRDRDRAHAASGTDLSERTDDGWAEAAWPLAAPVAGVAYGEATYAVAADGTVLADAGDGWRTRSIGLPDVTGCVVVA